MSPHDWLWAASLAVGALNAWQNERIRSSVLELKVELIERIAEGEKQIAVLRAQCPMHRATENESTPRPNGALAPTH